jgi:hypothetical protein
MTLVQNPIEMVRLHLCQKVKITGRASIAKRYGPTAVPVLVIGILIFEIYLVFGAWDLGFLFFIKP